MNTQDLYHLLHKEHIHLVYHSLSHSRGMIAHYQNVTVIVLDPLRIDTNISFRTVLFQELGHFYSGSYYRSYTDDDKILAAEFLADQTAWRRFFPYDEVKQLMRYGLHTVSEIADYYQVEPDYMARCLHFYYEVSHGFRDDFLDLALL